MIHVMQFQISEAPQLFLYWPMCPSHVPFSTSCPCSKRTTMHGSAAMGGKRERTCSSQRRIGAGGLLGPARSHGMRGGPGAIRRAPARANAHGIPARPNRTHPPTEPPRPSGMAKCAARAVQPHTSHGAGARRHAACARAGRAHSASYTSKPPGRAAGA